MEKAQDKSKCRLIYLTSGYSDKILSDFSISKPTTLKDSKLENYKVLDLEKDFITNWNFYDDIRNWLTECKSNHRLNLFIQDYIQYWDDTKLKKDFYMKKLISYFKNNEGEEPDWKESDWKLCYDAIEQMEEIKGLLSLPSESFVKVC